MTVPVALTIAGSDSSGGAGIQADLKTFAALGVYGASVITALTAQNTTGVSGIHQVPAGFVTAQIDAVFSDLTVAAVKIGMTKVQDLRYGENPHQTAAFYRDLAPAHDAATTCDRGLPGRIIAIGGELGIMDPVRIQTAT